MVGKRIKRTVIIRFKGDKGLYEMLKGVMIHKLEKKGNDPDVWNSNP